MKNFKELEAALLDQIEKLNDDSIGDDVEATKALVDRSKAMSDLTKNVIELNRLKLDVVHECAENGGLYESYLGIDDGKQRRA